MVGLRLARSKELKTLREGGEILFCDILHILWIWKLVKYKQTFFFFTLAFVYGQLKEEK